MGLALVLAGGLTGCEGPGKVIKQLPPPVVQLHQTPQKTTPKPYTAPPQKTGQSLVGTKIVIDPGHGGRDPGAWPKKTSRLPEKTIVLDIANQVISLLKQRGAQVVTTRTGDTFPSLNDRANLADRSKADMFVSIHADSAQRTAASGTQVFIYLKASTQSQKAALLMIGAFKRAGIETRGVDRANFHVLREHSRPAMLIETGFLTNPGDASKLNTPGYRCSIAEAIANGITSYLGR